MNGVGEFVLVFSWEHRMSFISCRTSTNAGSTCYIFSICSSIRTKVCFHTIIFRLDHNTFYVLLFFHLWSRSVCSLEPNFSSLSSPHPEASSRHELGDGGQNENKISSFVNEIHHTRLIVYNLSNLGLWWWIGDSLYVLDSCCWRNVSIFST